MPATSLSISPFAECFCGRIALWWHPHTALLHTAASERRPPGIVGEPTKERREKVEEEKGKGKEGRGERGGVSQREERRAGYVMQLP